LWIQFQKEYLNKIFERNRNRMKKIVKSSLLITILNLIFMIRSCAFSVTDMTGTKISNSNLTDTGNGIITVLTVIGTVISVIVLIILGLKYMMGSVEERAEYKKTMMPYVIGAALVFAASAIAGMIYSFAINLG
jgi:trbC/VIRB2 family